MSNSLADIIKNRNDTPKEPAEFAVIRAHIQKEYGVIPVLTLRDNQIIIGLPSASLAGSLRLVLHELAEQCKTKKRLTIRIIG